MKKHILVIDDDTSLSFIIKEMLENYGYEVTCLKNSEDAFLMLKKHTYHLILLDINLPTLNGFEICQELRKVSTVPVIFASARTSEDDRIVGFDVGGDDYLTKPYSMKELLSRVNALMRRTYDFLLAEEKESFGNIVVDMTTRNIWKDKERISLSLKEFDVLSTLLKYKNKTIAKEQLISEVWGAFSEVEPSTLTVHIRWLREKLEDNPAQPNYIKTVWGVGYRIEVAS